MVAIPGYHIVTKLYESVRSLVYRGYRDRDQQPFVFKVLKGEYPDPEALTRYRQEYEMTRSLNLEGVISAYALHPYRNTLVMVLEDFGGESLQHWLTQQPFSLEQVIHLALRITAIIGRLHQNQVIHKDINPANMIWNPTTDQLKLIDFGISTRISRENPTILSPNVLEGTLAYLSPEQTGRMNRSLDYRTDFYSFGVTLYELLTGRLPFIASDALELVHCHIAKHPKPPSDRQPTIPQPLSDVVMKLLAKTAEARYQSSQGIYADLEQCLSDYQRSSTIASFPLAQQDVVDKFQIPQRLYGRDREIEILLAAFARVAGEGNSALPSVPSELLLVSGYSGIGKTSLVQEIYKPITQRRGYFIAGKFDPYQRDIPYSALVAAFSSLVSQLLTESEAQLTHWRSVLLAALDVNAQVMVEVIPELALIIGQPPAVPELPPTEARNRFNRVFQQFIHVLATPEHPLVVFLDDLQWADMASLNLMQWLLMAEGRSLFWIGAYRDNEVSPTHPLMHLLEELRQTGTRIEAIALPPLSQAAISQLLSDTINCRDPEVEHLAALVFAKTQGNPFFVNEFLKALVLEGLLRFDPAQRRWVWAIAQIQQRDITTNVADLLSHELQKLPTLTQTVLRLAAGIGNQFNLQTLTGVLTRTGAVPQLDQQGAIAALHEAVRKGLIVPLNTLYQRVELGVGQPSDVARVEYKFCHDQIQQASYALNPDTERPQIHYHIGRLLLQTPALAQGFDPVNQLNIGRALLQSPAERNELARLNLIAGEKAKASAAYTSAFRYLQMGLELLEPDCWHTQYDLALHLHSAAAEAAYLNGDFATLETYATAVLQQATTPLDQIKIYEVKIQAYASQTRFLEALQMALAALELLGLQLPLQPTPEQIGQALAETAAKLAHRPIERLIDLPPMTDAIALAMMRVLASANAPAYQAAPALFPLIILNMVNLSLDYGNTALSSLGYGLYGIVVGAIVEDAALSYQLGQLALRLLEQADRSPIRCKTVFVANTSVLWRKDHLRTTIQPLLDAYQSGLDQGDLEFAGYSILHHCDHLFFVGEPLAALEQKIAAYIKALAQLNEVTNADALRMYQQAIHQLLDPPSRPGVLIGEYYDESQQLPLLQQANHQKGLFYLYCLKLLLCYWFDDLEGAIAAIAQAERYLDGGRANAIFPIFYWYSALTRLQQLAQAEPAERERLAQEVATLQAKLRTWADDAPMNCLHKWYVVEAERLGYLGDVLAAMEAYDRAIELATVHGYGHEAALAYERAAVFYLAQNKPLIAKAYLQEARYGYLKWGATAKVTALEQRYQPVLGQLASPSTAIADSAILLRTTGSANSATLDLLTVIKAAQVLSGELNVEKLLAQLMTIVLENAGAQIGIFLLEQQGQLYIKSIGMADPASLTMQQPVPLETTDQVPISLVHYVARTQETIVLDQASRSTRFASDPYIQSRQPKSVLCTPIQGHGRLVGVLYLENNLATDVFTVDRLAMLRVLTSQAAIALENAQLYEQLAQYSQTLEVKNQELQQEVSDRRQAEASLKLTLAERDILLKEIHHRVKNNLQIISGLLQLQAHSVTDAATLNILRESQHRIESMSLIHKKLYSSSDFGQIDLSDYIPSLAHSLMISYQIGSAWVSLHLNIEPILLNIDQAIPCGLIVNELISNALKYAFPDQTGGELHIHLHSTPDQQLELTIRDNGIGLPETVDWEYTQSLGLSLVRDLVVEQLEGDITVERQQGTTFRIHFPQSSLWVPRLSIPTPDG